MMDVVCHYFDPDKAPLVRRHFIPLARSLAGEGFAVHLDRHWLHGPHVLLRFEPGAGVEATAARAAEECRRHLAGHPSTVAVDEAALLAEAEQAGRAELIPGPYTPIRPDNTVLVREADLGALTALLGSPEAVAGRCALLALGLDAVAGSLDYLADRDYTANARIVVALAAMTAHSANYPAGLGRGYQSFLSHVEDFLAYDDPDGTLRTAFDRHWSTHAPGVTAIVRAAANPDGAVASPEGAGADVGGSEGVPGDLRVLAAGWRGWSSAAWRYADATLDTGALIGSRNGHAAVAARLGGETEIRWDFTRRHFSDYHQLLNRSNFPEIAVSREFGVYRFGTNVLYRLLALCDLRPLERYLAAYLFSRAVEEINGVTWRELLEPVVRSR
ncbi:lantibiotic dehydratase C-terminal domain-containing protein [Microtetraspora malaysiensis]|uniref:lantibiotic dehydratase C-terminal domain-containing protein n=1 Tax=Microtetraspora malaysiensis TaxID=161358 RepID=UPI0008358802|nr:lantibiotic dehydratase C-terminal domain-containing protein [Microtetraspora malaysiensis]